MKSLLLLFFLPLSSYAGLGKPELIARFSDRSAYKAPDNTWCFSSDPAILNGKVYLKCMDILGSLMIEFGDEGKVIARAQEDQIFSSATTAFGRVNWYEFNEWGAVKSFELGDKLTEKDLKTIGPMNQTIDHVAPASVDSIILRTKGENPELWISQGGKATPFFNPGASYLFRPFVSLTGTIVIKSREINYNESSPDKLWLYSNNQWKMILEDRDSNPNSPWKIFRQSFAIEGEKVLLVATDDQGEALLLIDQGKVKIIARAGKDLKKFDYFSPSMNGGTVAIRGEDFNGRKVLYVHDQDGFRPLLTQGDIVHTDLGLGKVDYSNQDSIFYSSPGVDEKGNVYQQATLVDADYPKTLLGVGLIKFSKE